MTCSAQRTQSWWQTCLTQSQQRQAGSYGCEVWSTPFLAGWHLRDCTLQRLQAAVYKQSLKLTRSTSNLLLVFLEMGRYPMQIQWLQRTLSYWNKLVANKANSKLLKCVLAAEVCE
jgi:hypothetical protein